MTSRQDRKLEDFFIAEPARDPISLNDVMWRSTQFELVPTGDDQLSLPVWLGSDPILSSEVMTSLSPEYARYP